MSQTDVSTALSRTRWPVISQPYDEDFLPTNEELRRLCDQFGVTHPIQAIVWAARRGPI